MTARGLLVPERHRVAAGAWRAHDGCMPEFKFSTKKAAKDCLASLAGAVCFARQEEDRLAEQRLLGAMEEAFSGLLAVDKTEPRSVVVQVETKRHKWQTVAWATVLYADSTVVLVRAFGTESMYRPDGEERLVGWTVGHPGVENLPEPMWRWRIHPASVARLRAWLEAAR